MVLVNSSSIMQDYRSTVTYLTPKPRMFQEEYMSNVAGEGFQDAGQYHTGICKQKMVQPDRFSPSCMSCDKGSCVFSPLSSGELISLADEISLPSSSSSPVSLETTMKVNGFRNYSPIKESLRDRIVQQHHNGQDRNVQPHHNGYDRNVQQHHKGHYVAKPELSPSKSGKELFPYPDSGIPQNQTSPFHLPPHHSHSCFIVSDDHDESSNLTHSSSPQSRHKQEQAKMKQDDAVGKSNTLTSTNSLRMFYQKHPHPPENSFNTWHSNSPEKTFNTWNLTSDGLLVCKNNNRNTATFKTSGSLKMPDYSEDSYGDPLIKETIQTATCRTKRDSNTDTSQKLRSQSYTAISLPARHQSFQIPKISCEDFAGKSVHPVYDSSPSSPTANGIPTGNRQYYSLPRRRSNDLHLRRAVSYEPRIPENKPVIAKSPSQCEIESEYVTIDKRYTLPTYTPLSEHSEGKGYYKNPLYNTTLLPPVNCSPIRANQLPIHGSETDVSHAYPFIASTNQMRSNESMTKTITPADPNKQTQKKNNNSGTFRTITDTIGSLFSGRNSSDNLETTANHMFMDNRAVSFSSPIFVDGTDSISSAQHTTDITFSYNSNEYLHENHHQTLTRSKSLSDLQACLKESDDTNKNYSEDEDGDDYGFLSYPILFNSSCTSAAMNKVKSSGNKIFTKRWRKKTNAAPTVSTSVAMWSPGPQGSYTWSSVSGRKVQLRPGSILKLTEDERMTLQKIALSKLQSMDIGCAIIVPKETSDLPRAKKSPLSLKRRIKSVSAPALDTMARDGTAPGLVFGIPLHRCILNDRELEKRRKRMAAVVGPVVAPSPTKMRTDSSDSLLTFRSIRKSSSSSQSSADNSSVSQRLDSLTVPSSMRTTSCDSLSDSSNNTNSSLIDALSLSTSNPTSRPSSLALDSNHIASHREIRVPNVVRSCFKHIETYGLQTLGIFRVGSSKKRVKQLREEFDCGKDVELTEDHNPHDVGALLKEYFRDLPDPLLTRELYLPFLYAERIQDEHQRHMAISLLISLLPVPNRDTLWALLRFLALVTQHATDLIDDKGTVVSGNKMDSHNLATLFGPNILHRSKAANEKELMTESAERVEQSKEVIEVVKDMIDNHHELFEISQNLRDDVLRMLVQASQEAVDRILRHLANENQIETDPESTCSVFEESSYSSVLYHSTNSDADLVAFARKHTVSPHHPLRITKSLDDTLDSPTSNLLDLNLVESQVFSQKDNQKSSPSYPAPLTQHRFDTNQTCPNNLTSKIPNLKTPNEPASPEVILRGRLEIIKHERPYSEGFNQCLNIPRQIYPGENISSSINGSQSSIKGHSGSDIAHFGQWVLPTPPTSRGSSPKPIIRSASSSSTLIASSPKAQFNYEQSDNSENRVPAGLAEWERERWEYWKKIAAQKMAVESEQETLV